MRYDFKNQRDYPREQSDAGQGLKTGGGSPSQFSRCDTDSYSTCSLEERLNTPYSIKSGQRPTYGGTAHKYCIFH